MNTVHPLLRNSADILRVAQRRRKAWALLEQLLLRHDSVQTNFALRARVADQILSSNDRLALPPWLISLFKVMRRLHLSHAANRLDSLT